MVLANVVVAAAIDGDAISFHTAGKGLFRSPSLYLFCYVSDVTLKKTAHL